MKKHWIPFLLAFVLPLVLVFWWWGGFNQARFELAQRGPYRYAYLSQKGDYYKLPEKQMEVLKTLQQQGLQAGTSITVLLNDPRTTPKREWSAQVGYLVDAGASVSDPLLIGNIPARSVVLVKVRAQPLLAPGKAYSALLDYLDEHHMKLNLPTVELYQDGELTVEVTR
ncbi:MAG: AraC family transcriptional regulator [Sulfuricella denitrificans]|nr:AraC family transcriptional regulator [Sulfuricella denitrificans]